MAQENLKGSRPRNEAFRKPSVGDKGKAGKSYGKDGRPKSADKGKPGGKSGLNKSNSFPRRNKLKRAHNSGRSDQSGDEEEDDTAKTGVDEEEAHLAETHDNRFVHLRAQVARTTPVTLVTRCNAL